MQRLLELRLSNRNRKIILEKGGHLHKNFHSKLMPLLHIAWLGSMIIEVYYRNPMFSWSLTIPFTLLFFVGQVLRYKAITTLGWRWNIEIMTVPKQAPVSDGIYRHIRHPNYLGVIIEIVSLPLVCQAYLTALVFTLLNGLMIYIRINAEEQALQVDNAYDANMTSAKLLPELKGNK